MILISRQLANALIALQKDTWPDWVCQALFMYVIRFYEITVGDG